MKCIINYSSALYHSRYIIKVLTHCSGGGGGSGYRKMTSDTILPANEVTPPRQINFTATSAVCGDLYRYNEQYTNNSFCFKSHNALSHYTYIPWHTCHWIVMNIAALQMSSGVEVLDHHPPWTRCFHRVVGCKWPDQNGVGD